MSFLKLEGKSFLVTGVANKKSVAAFVTRALLDQGAKVLLTVQHEENEAKAKKLFPDCETLLCDVESESSIKKLAETLKGKGVVLSGLLHSIAFANYSEGLKPFHETLLKDFLQATNISCFSLVSLTNALKDLFTKEASIVTISISSTRATNYGYMGPIKAALDSTVAFLAKSLSEFSRIRVNAVCAGPLKTSASAGIPGYIENYLFAEQLTMRKEALKTEEVANTVLFLLSEVSSGVNATGIIVDAGMSANYFDQSVVSAANKT